MVQVRHGVRVGVDGEAHAGLEQKAQGREEAQDLGGALRTALGVIDRDGADLGRHQEASFVVENGGAEGAPAGTKAETVGILSQGGRERRQRLSLERLMRCVLDGQAIRAQDQHHLDAIALGQAAYHVSHASKLWPRL